MYKKAEKKNHEFVSVRAWLYRTEIMSKQINSGKNEELSVCVLEQI